MEFYDACLDIKKTFMHFIVTEMFTISLQPIDYKYYFLLWESKNFRSVHVTFSHAQCTTKLRRKEL